MMTTRTSLREAVLVMVAAGGCGVSVGEPPNLGGSMGDSAGDEDESGPAGSSGGDAAADESTGGDTTAADPGDQTSTPATTDASEGDEEAGGEDSDDGSSGSSSGEAPSDGDADDDGLPDDDDPFPNDAALPGTVPAGVVYAQTATALFTLDVEDFTIAEIGEFTFPQGGGGWVTDLAIDRWGVLYAITFDDLLVCNPMTAECYVLAALPSLSNGSTFVAPGTLDPLDDTLIGIAITGDWRQIALSGGVAMQMVLGGYGAGYTSSGDAFSIAGVGTFAAVDLVGEADDVIVEVDPLTGAVQSQLATLVGYSAIYGLAGSATSVFAFDATGAVLRIDIATGAVTLLAQTPHAWWGAAVATVSPT